jgi:hypothetical protein
VTGTPSCSVHGDLESGLTEQAPPPTSPVSDVVVLDTLVTFRLSIDW